MGEGATMTFGQKLAALYERMAYAKKGGFNSHFKYAFVGEAQLKRMLNEAMREVGLNISSVMFDPIGECSGKAAVVRCSMTVTDPESGARVLWQGIGGGSDSSDKAPMKAVAAAWKYAVMCGCALETGDRDAEDGEADDARVRELLERIGECSDLPTLQGLKSEVASFRESPSFGELKAAFKAASARAAA